MGLLIADCRLRIERRLSGLDERASKSLLAYIDRLLAAFPGLASGPPGQSAVQNLQSAIIEPLSDREFDVLRLLAENRTNREIAQAMCVSVNTVKTHLKNVYGKLGVHNRRRAVARAKELGLL